MANKPVLGRGLGALLEAKGYGQIPQKEAQATEAQKPTSIPSAASEGPRDITVNKDRIPGISMAQPEDIRVNPYQPRREFDAEKLEELALSLKESGVIQPIVVRKMADGYELIAGERRLRAAKMAGLKQIPIIIRKSSDKESLELALVENIQRENLNCVEEAMAYFRLQEEFHLSQEEVAQRVGKERASVANSLRLLRLPTDVQEDLKRGLLTFGHGKVLASIEDRQMLLSVRASIIEKALSVRDTESLVQTLKMEKELGPSGATAAGKPIDVLQQRIKSLSDGLTRTWSTKVEIKGSEARGKFVVHYRNRADFERLLNALQESRTWAAQTKI